MEEKKPIEILILTGQAGYHSWQLNHKALQDAFINHSISQGKGISHRIGTYGGWIPDGHVWERIQNLFTPGYRMGSHWQCFTGSGSRNIR